MKESQEKIIKYRTKSSRQRYRCRRCGTPIFLVLKSEGVFIAAHESYRGKTPIFRGQQLFDERIIVPHFARCFQNPDPPRYWHEARFDGMDVQTKEGRKLLRLNDPIRYYSLKEKEYAEAFLESYEEDHYARSVERSDGAVDLGRVLDERCHEDAALSGSGYLDWCDRALGPGNPAAIEKDLGEDFEWEELRRDASERTDGPVGENPDFD